MFAVRVWAVSLATNWQGQELVTPFSREDFFVQWPCFSQLQLPRVRFNGLVSFDSIRVLASGDASSLSQNQQWSPGKLSGRALTGQFLQGTEGPCRDGIIVGMFQQDLSGLAAREKRFDSCQYRIKCERTDRREFP